MKDAKNTVAFKQMNEEENFVGYLSFSSRHSSCVRACTRARVCLCVHLSKHSYSLFKCQINFSPHLLPCYFRYSTILSHFNYFLTPQRCSTRTPHHENRWLYISYTHAYTTLYYTSEKKKEPCNQSLYHRERCKAI